VLPRRSLPLARGAYGFNPHRARRPGATLLILACRLHVAVSILTGPGGPVLRGRGLEARVPLIRFQSSPGPEARCYALPKQVTSP